jgi:hypothetical protein
MALPLPFGNLESKGTENLNGIFLDSKMLLTFREGAECQGANEFAVKFYRM